MFMYNIINLFTNKVPIIINYYNFFCRQVLIKKKKCLKNIFIYSNKYANNINIKRQYYNLYNR